MCNGAGGKEFNQPVRQYGGTEGMCNGAGVKEFNQPVRQY
jgi:hypothetical protein